jgi:hypothetical protein
MISTQEPVFKKPSPVRLLIFLAVAFLFGFECSRHLRFTFTLLSYVFGWGLLCIPFFALRPLSQLPKVSKIVGYVLISPILFLSLLMILSSVACDLDLHPYCKGSCAQVLGKIEEEGYSVHLIRDDCGGAISSSMIEIQQRRSLFPGIYAYRYIDIFDSAYEGKMSWVGPNQIRVQIPTGVQGSGWNREVDREYTLKRFIYF